MKLPLKSGVITPILFLSGIVFLLLLQSCCHCLTSSSSVNPVRPAKAYEYQLVIWQNPNSSPDAFNRWLKRFKDTIRLYGEITDSRHCPTCDDSLILLTGPGPLIYMQQQTAGGSGGTGTGGTGGSGPGYYCANLNIYEPEWFKVKAITGLTNDIMYYPRDTFRTEIGIYPQPKTPDSGSAITVAVFDTGLDSTLQQYVLENIPTCNPVPQSRYGWNFVSNNSNTQDDDSIRHGSTVTRFILDQAQQYNPGSVSILLFAGSPTR